MLRKVSIEAPFVWLALLVAPQANAATFLDYPVELGKQTLRLYLNDTQGNPLGQFQRLEQMLASRGEKLVFAMNAGIFMVNLRPLGLYVENGKVLRRLVIEKSGEFLTLFMTGSYRSIPIRLRVW